MDSNPRRGFDYFCRNAKIAQHHVSDVDPKDEQQGCCESSLPLRSIEKQNISLSENLFQNSIQIRTQEEGSMQIIFLIE